MVMKKILIPILAALLLATPAISAEASESAVSAPAPKAKTETVTFSVNMHCKKCVEKLTDNLSFEKGVKDLKISLEDKTVTITFNPSKTNKENLAAAIEKCGYKAEVIRQK